MRILTWNINGIRACKQSLKQELCDLSGDIVCLQETKITRDLLDEETAIQDGYSSYFSFSKKKSGYSGVATYCKAHATPVSAEEGLSGILTDKMKGTSDVIGHYGDLSEFTNEELISLDSEGRAILTEHQYRDSYGNIRQLVVINVYCPRADPDREGRLNYKLQFYKLLQIRAEALLKAKKSVIILGDFNVSHKPIDHCNPDADDEKFYARPSRHWLGQLLMDTSSSCKSATKQNSQKKLSKFIDTFRYFHPKQEHAFTCWSTVTGARITNYGTRIDYIVSDVNLCQEEFDDCEIVQDFEGSDHCPVRATLKGTPEPFDKLPSMCTKFMPEFYGRQQKLSTFFTKGLEKEKSAKTERTQAIGSASLGKEKLPSSWKRNLGKSDYEPSFKRTKSDSKNKSHKTVSITNFFKKVPSATQGSSSKETQNLNDMQLQNNTDQIDDITKTCHIGKVPRSDEDKGIDGGKTEGSLGMTGETNSSETNELVKGTDVRRSKTKKQMVSSWKDILKGPRPPPLCKGHKEPCLLRTVKKPGPNLGKQFYVCCRPEGHKSNPEARCNNFEWVVSLKKLKEVKGDEHERETKI